MGKELSKTFFPCLIRDMARFNILCVHEMDIVSEIFVKNLKFFFTHMKVLFFPQIQSTHISTPNKIFLYDVKLGHHKLSQINF